MTDSSRELMNLAEELCRVAHKVAARGWVPATSGNFSVRNVATGHVLVTASGLDKSQLTPAGLLEVAFDASGSGEYSVVAGNGKPSAETRIHGVLYHAFPQAGAIIHGHSIWNTLLSNRFLAEGAVTITGYELLKALSGVTTHEHIERIPVVENSQEYAGLSRRVSEVVAAEPSTHGVLLAGHGLYTWGQSAAEAWRHMEALEFLFECEARRIASGW